MHFYLLQVDENVAGRYSEIEQAHFGREIRMRFDSPQTQAAFYK